MGSWDDRSRRSSTQLEAELQDEGGRRSPLAARRVNALANQDVELADDVIAFDDEIDEALPRDRGGRSSRCSRARRPSPSTSDSCSRCSTSTIHLERMADHCVTIAKLTKLASELDAEPRRSSRGSTRWERGARR